jgi:hypothetical protein
VISTGIEVIKDLGGSKSKKSKAKKDAQAADSSKKRPADAMASNAGDDKFEIDEASTAAVLKQSKKQKKAAKASKDSGILAEATEAVANASAQLVDAVTGNFSKSKTAEKENAEENTAGTLELEKSSKTEESVPTKPNATITTNTEELVAVKEKISKKKRKQQRKENLVQAPEDNALEKVDGDKDPEVRLQTLDELIANRGLPPQTTDVKPSKSKSKKSKSKKAKETDSTPVLASTNAAGKPNSSKDANQNTPDAQNLAELAQATGVGAEEFEGLSGSEQESNVEEDDQTAAFLAGFESDTEEPPSGDEGYTPSKQIPALDKSIVKEIEKLHSSKNTDKKEPGVVYIGFVNLLSFDHLSI